jgi:Gas vesicle synthesis protein GvpL/GvpF
LAELRSALVKAALAERSDTPGTPAPRRSSPPTGRSESASAPSGDGIWVYCVAAADAELPTRVPTVHAGATLEHITHKGLKALASRVPLSEFGEEGLRDNLNDLDWLERVARAHEAVLDAALEAATIVPLRLCTIFADVERVREMLTDQGPAIADALERLVGREEWGVKLLVDPAAIEAAAREHDSDATALEQELETRTGGGAYIVQRRLERHVREVADRMRTELAEDVHARFQDWADDAVLSAPQNPELSGHKGEMLLNGAYLFERSHVDRLRGLATELEDRYRSLGATLELTGPWPPYNFVPRDAGRT